MPKDLCDKALKREVELDNLHTDINDAMNLLNKIKKEFTGMSETLWPLIFSSILLEVRSIRRIEESLSTFPFNVEKEIKNFGDLNDVDNPSKLHKNKIVFKK